MEKRKVIIDCDPGIDDSLAILLALNSDELEVLGLTITSGNVPARMGAKNALKTLQIANRLDIPVYVGEEFPLQRKLITAQDTHGEDGIGENFYDDVKGEILEGGVDFIIDTLKREEKVSIIALGPLTNIAKALMKDKDGFDNLDEFVSMGGAFRIHGNCSPVAEFNYWVDPHAADYTYKHLPKKIHMVGLDVTRKIVLTPNIIEFINRLEKEKSKFITEITRFYIDFHWQQEGIIGCVINDPLAVAYFIDRNLCKGFDSYVEVVHDGVAIGQSIVDSFNFYKKEPNAHVLTQTDEKAFMKMFLKRIFKGYEEIIDATEGVI
ncbi:MAG: nucleoside hydrolase [Clostridiales bacterium]|uniref:nucleoside hydrolase n=1 Tax=Terrisporobacter sp. TaxID=1965305 RepID=UPI002A535CB3|nr:nucleoside hydrolase [Terrisporobacter sp.]MCI7207366.1 nucleoside hydrolase [Clostridium sp.]MDD7754809.1 nucleoside hydrolase [Clostridiales bacterium]MDY4135257.1 nucleoside hydrolase [Terrisporobacter sp.]MDY4737678.1 nucleoside hydrolase [Terrisporobacter sp.]